VYASRAYFDFTTPLDVCCHAQVLHPLASNVVLDGGKFNSSHLERLRVWHVPGFILQLFDSSSIRSLGLHRSEEQQDLHCVGKYQWWEFS
jgi:hypothetical protein